MHGTCEHLSIPAQGLIIALSVSSLPSVASRVTANGALLENSALLTIVATKSGRPCTDNNAAMEHSYATKHRKCVPSEWPFSKERESKRHHSTTLGYSQQRAEDQGKTQSPVLLSYQIIRSSIADMMLYLFKVPWEAGGKQTGFWMR